MSIKRRIFANVLEVVTSGKDTVVQYLRTYVERIKTL